MKNRFIKFCLFLTFGAYIHASPQALLQDKIKGAIIGSAIGDALGRVASRLSSLKSIKEAYGEKGLKTFRAFKNDDWVFDEGESRIAAYTAHTMFALMVFDECTVGRKHNRSIDQLASIVSKKAQDLTHSDKDPFHSVRRYSKKIEKSQALSLVWPVGIVFSDNFDIVQLYAQEQTIIDKNDKKTLAAALAFARGIASAIQGCSADEIVDHMISIAYKYDEAETDCSLNDQSPTVLREAIRNNELSIGDMIRYAATCARQRMQPREFLPTTKEASCSEKAGQCVAAAVYVFIRHSQDLREAICEGANIPGAGAIIGSLAGALTGAYVGLRQMKTPKFTWDLEMLENINVLQNSCNELLVVRTDYEYMQTGKAMEELEKMISKLEMQRTLEEIKANIFPNRSGNYSSNYGDLEDKISEAKENAQGKMHTSYSAQSSRVTQDKSDFGWAKAGMYVGFTGLAAWLVWKYALPYAGYRSV